MLHLDQLPLDTKAVFELLRQSPELEGAVLVGGTALALQLRHRLSQDLDFVFARDRLPESRINAMINRLAKSHSVQNMISPSDIVQAKINHGLRLESMTRRYSVNGVKLEFWAEQKPGRRELILESTKNSVDAHFPMMGVSGLFEMKSLAIGDRRRSRDLFDLYYLVSRHGYSVADILSAVRKREPGESTALHEAFLIGEVGADESDEGFDAVGVKVTVEEIQSFFRGKYALEIENQVAGQVRPHVDVVDPIEAEILSRNVLKTLRGDPAPLSGSTSNSTKRKPKP